MSERPGPSLTLTDQAETLLQDEIVFGHLPPGERLVLPTLGKRIGIGLTPMREALSRLVNRGLVTVEGNKGFRVAAVSRQDLVDLTETRAIIELAALRLSMQSNTGEWQDGIALAIHRLTRIVRQFEGSILDNITAYEAAHKAFHSALIAGCGLNRLIDMQSTLYDQAFRYRRLLAETGMVPSVAITEHQKLADLAVSGKEEEACAALKEHLGLTLSAVSSALA
ncbi:GntR family transcriptional regulator [Rhizobium sp. C4]|uniref:GntR family transcriptional regulator n=1 Tax=Rhizobium sp. C4 TaxID=1349800 RepID=UPI001E2C818F|nr:GntR family transcriptional regulator [Rhizobium sp. C4]MCD2172311.1 GntR family transcriptional regulator [Rhizobium sp. C4]